MFAGPVLDPRDQIFAGVDETGAVLRCRIPSAFWKVVVAKRSDTELVGYAFVLDQDLSDVALEFTVSNEFRRRMVSVAALEARTGVIFPDAVRDADVFEEDAGEAIAFRAGLERAPRTPSNRRPTAATTRPPRRKPASRPRRLPVSRRCAPGGSPRRSRCCARRSI